MLSLLDKVKLWVKRTAKVEWFKVSPSWTVKYLFEELGYDIEKFHEYLITLRKERVAGIIILGDITTSQDQPLIIEKFSCWIQCEDDPVVMFPCRPSIVIYNLPNSLPIAFHKGERIDSGLEIWALFTSKTDPLIFKDSKLTINIDGSEVKTKVVCDNIEGLFQEAEKKINSEVNHVAYNKDGKRIDDLNAFILGTKSNQRCLYLRKRVLDGPSYHHPESVSKSSDKDIMKYSTDYEVYKHWISLSVYDHYYNSSEAKDSSAEEFSQRFKMLMTHQYQGVLGTLEHTYSSVIFQALDRFLFPGGTEGCVLHQPVLAKDHKQHNNRPDGYVLYFKDGLPSLPILVSDFKKEDKDYDTALNESIGYFQVVVSAARLYVPMLVMPCTPNQLSLFLCWPTDNRNHATIRILEKVEPNEKFFSALKFAVEKVNGVGGSNQRFQVEPIQGVALIEVLKSPNVYKLNNHVYKLFDTNYSTKVNNDLVEKILGKNYLSEMAVQQLTRKGCYCLLTYQYILPASGVRTLDDFKPVAVALQKLHDAKYVHSDVRMANIVFTDDGNSKLIDFDLTDKIDTLYPKGYNDDFPERHPEANERGVRKIVHDRFSFIYLIRISFFKPGDEQNDYLRDEVVTETDLSIVLSNLK